MENFFTPDINRGTYERIVKLLAGQMNLSPDQFVQSYKVMPGTIKMAAYLQPGLSSYSLSPRKGVDNPQIPNSILLDFNDFFAITSIGLRFARATYASGVYSNQGNYPVLTYPDPNYFSNTGTAVGDERTGLQCVVNGTTAITVNNDAMIDPISNQELVYNPEGTYVASPLTYPRFGASDGNRGQFPLTPQIILDASADNAIQVNLANGLKLNIDGNISTGTTDSGTRNILYVFMYGIKIKNLAGAGNAVCGKV